MPSPSRPLRIAYPINMMPWGDSPGAGIGRYLFELAQALYSNQRDLDIELLLIRGNNEPAPPFQSMNSLEFPGLRESFCLPARKPAVAEPAGPARTSHAEQQHPSRFARIRNLLNHRIHSRFISRQKADLVHYGMHLGTPPAPRGIPLVITVHDLVPHLYPATITDRTRRGWQEFLAALPRATHFFCVSESVAHDLETHLGLPRNRMTVTHHGVSPVYAPPADRPQALERLHARYQVRPPYLLLVSTIEPRKNQETAIRALLDLPEELVLVLAGGAGWKSEGLPALISELGLEKRVHFPGFIAEEDLPALYGCAETFVFPSHYEGFGLPLIEAMACGTPVVCSRNGALQEVAGDAAILVDASDARGLATAIRQLREAPLLREKYRSAGLRRSATFTWRAAAEATVRGYHRALEAAGGSRTQSR